MTNAPRALADSVVARLRRHAEPLPSPADASSFDAAFDRFGGARMVLLGEATHGTSEFYRARAAISRYLIEHHGFLIVAVADLAARWFQHHFEETEDVQRHARLS